MRTLPCSISIAFAVLFCSGCTEKSPSPPAFTLSHIVSTVIVVTPPSPGTGTEIRHDSDAGLQGKKTVLVSLVISRECTVRAIEVMYWKAGNSIAKDSVIRTENDDFSPEPGRGLSATYSIALPGTEGLDLCDGLYFRTSVKWSDPNGQEHFYVSETEGLQILRREGDDVEEPTPCGTMPPADA